MPSRLDKDVKDTHSSGSDTLRTDHDDDNDKMSKTTNDQATMVASPTTLQSSDEKRVKSGDEKKKNKKKRGFWARLRACFVPCLDEHDDGLQDHSDPAGRTTSEKAKATTTNASTTNTGVTKGKNQSGSRPGTATKENGKSAKKGTTTTVEANVNGNKKTGEADSNRLTDETAVSSSSSSANHPPVAAARPRPGAYSASTPSNRGSVHTRNSLVLNPPHLLIPNGPVNLTAPSTPAYNTFELDPNQDVVIPPTPKAGASSHLLPVDETEGVTSGAVQPPGGIGGHQGHDALGLGGSTSSGGSEKEESDRGTFTDDGDYHETKEEDDIEAEEMRLILNGGSGIPIVDGKPKPLLPPLAEKHKGRKCLVLDMDETLLHSSFKMMPQHDFTVPVEIEWQWHNAYVLKRPGVEEFLRRMGELYEVIVYTASVSKYADPVLDKVDTHKAVSYRLFRESCYNHRGNYVKDLSMLGRPLDTCIILDNSPASYLFHPNNAVPVTTWFNDPLDTELTDLIGFLTDLADVEDVRPLLAREC
ncbi:hypothetical protein FRC19_002139 [Serendipita sp. 401]|nr:hypothetical protein FRC19_002139 [Serendipita sp. 401]